MHGRRGGGDPFFGSGDPFPGFGSFGGHMSLASSFFGGRDPFDDPFFTNPLGSMLQSSPFGSMLQSGPFGHMLRSSPFESLPQPSPFGGMLHSSLVGPGGGFFTIAPSSGFLEHQPSQSSASRGPIIEELDSDEEKEEREVGQENRPNPRKHSRSNEESYVEHPDDVVEEKKCKQIQRGNELRIGKNEASHSQANRFVFQSSTVSYGGPDGTYYTSSSTRRAGSDGLTFEEHKEADSATGQAAHRVSRGIYDKGHTINRNLNSDGRVDTSQILHNINEEDISGFNQAWNGAAGHHLPAWTFGSNVREGSIGTAPEVLPGRGGWVALPSTEHPNLQSNMDPEVGCISGPAQVQQPAQMGSVSTRGMAERSGLPSTINFGTRNVSGSPHMQNRGQMRANATNYRTMNSGTRNVSGSFQLQNPELMRANAAATDRTMNLGARNVSGSPHLQNLWQMRANAASDRTMSSGTRNVSGSPQLQNPEPRRASATATDRSMNLGARNVSGSPHLQHPGQMRATDIRRSIGSMGDFPGSSRSQHIGQIGAGANIEGNGSSRTRHAAAPIDRVQMSSRKM